MTYSIAAVDIAKGEVGGAGTSCLDGGDVFVIYRGVPGRGVVLAQAHYSVRGRERAAELLSQGRSAADALAAVTQSSFDTELRIRQYGVVDVSGGAAAFTGAGTSAFAGDLQGTTPGFAYSVQGNILTSNAVLQQASAAFEASGCDLAERLMQALLAGAEHGEGDSRCISGAIPSDSAFLQVERPGAAEGAHLALRIESSGRDNPLPLLEAKLDAWRADHPCPTVAPTPMPGSSEGSGPESSGACGCALPGDCALPERPSDVAGGCLLGLLLVAALVRRRRPARQLRPSSLT